MSASSTLTTPHGTAYTVHGDLAAASHVFVAVHGLANDRSMWEPYGAALAAAGAALIAFDSVGEGETPWPPRFTARRVRDADLLVEQLFDDVVAHVVDGAGVDGGDSNDTGVAAARTKVALLGYSQGGAVCVHAASLRPDRVSALHLFAPAGLPFHMPLTARLATRSTRTPEKGRRKDRSV
jgi:pimeloyl-ACP methyl ester carboxylesterase